MSSANALLLAIVGVVAVPALVLLLKKARQAEAEAEELVARRFAGKKIRLVDPHAVHVSQQSRGYSQTRGSGKLILTDEELFFVMAFPRIVHAVPLGAIGKLERVYRMLGHCSGLKFLKINFKDEQGRDDALGIRMKDMDRWEAEIRKATA